MEKNDPTVYMGLLALAAVATYHGYLSAGLIIVGLTTLLCYDREVRKTGSGGNEDA